MADILYFLVLLERFAVEQWVLIAIAGLLFLVRWLRDARSPLPGNRRRVGRTTWL
jgi:hypothetical protein